MDEYPESNKLNYQENKYRGYLPDYLSKILQNFQLNNKLWQVFQRREKSIAMLKIYKSMETGPLKELTLKSLEKGAWINIVAPTPYELKVVGNLTHVRLS